MPNLKIRVPNWREFNPRTDVKKPSWFRLAHDLFENEDFYKFSHAEILAWLYILCACSKKNSDTVTVDLERVLKVGRIQEADFLSAVEKLKALKCISLNAKRTSRVRNASDTATNATNERGGRTRRDGGNGAAGPSPIVGTREPEEVTAKLWGERQDLIEHYGLRFKEAHKAEPVIAEEDVQALARVQRMKGMTELRIKKLLSMFVNMEETWFRKHGWDLKSFEADIKKIVVRAAA